MTRVRRILFVELLGGLGDVLLALPAVHALALSHPQAEVDVLTFSPGDSLLAHDPHVARVLSTADHGEGAPRAAVARALSATAYDLAVTTTTYDGIGELCAGAVPRSMVNLWQQPPDDELVDRRFLRLLVESGLVAREHMGTPLQVHLAGPERARGWDLLADSVPGDLAPVVLVPGAGMAVKEWGGRRWAHLAGVLAAQGIPVVCVTADGLGVPAGVRVLPAGDLRHLAGMFAAVGERGGVVVGGDTGPVRLASGAGASTVSVFGATAAGRYGLSAPGATTLQGWPGCPERRPTAITEQTCWWTARCPYGPEPRCMAEIPVGDVLARVRTSLQR